MNDMVKKSPQKLRFAVLATDGVVFALHEGVLFVRLIKVVVPEFAGRWGLPGGLIHPNEVADVAMERHLKEKADLQDPYTEQLYTFSNVGRDPRGRVVSVAYLGLVRPDQMGSMETKITKWCPVSKVSKLAYDHNEIISVAVERLRARVGYTNIMQFLLPREFTLSELQSTYETVLGRELDKRNFRKKVIELGFVKGTGHQQRGGAHRPADLYRFSEKEVKIVEVL